MTTIESGSDKWVDQSKKKAKLRTDHQEEDLLKLLESYSGRHVLWDILEECGIYHELFSPDHAVMSFRAGKRKIGLWLLAEIHKVSKTAFILMQSEATKRDEQYGLQ